MYLDSLHHIDATDSMFQMAQAFFAQPVTVLHECYNITRILDAEGEEKAGIGALRNRTRQSWNWASKEDTPYSVLLTALRRVPQIFAIGEEGFVFDSRFESLLPLREPISFNWCNLAERSERIPCLLSGALDVRTHPRVVLS